MEQKIYNIISDHLDAYTKRIVEKYPFCEKDVLLMLWSSNGDVKVCSHVFAKGKRMGVQCTQRIFDEDEKCSKHKSRPKKTSTSKIEATNLKMMEKLSLNIDHSEDESE